MNTCETCKYYKKKNKNFGDCSNPFIIPRVNMNSDMKLLNNNTVFSHSGKYQSIGKNFGCIHHLPKRRPIVRLI